MNKTKNNHRLACFLIVLGGCTIACADSPTFGVGGIIDQDTHWTLDDSPVMVESTVTVVNSAQLVISPGVVVAFSEGASLEVEDGALYARGTVQQGSITFTSEQDIDGLPAAPGDWGSIVLGPGTQVSATLLENLHISYGHGIRIEGSSPQLNHIVLEHNAGAAIDIDLKASPVGTGLIAQHNDINGIRVPAGQIADDVVWALRGIPYVVEQGTVRVGREAFAVVPREITLAAGVVADLQLLLPEPAPPGGLAIDLTSSVPGVLQTAASTMVPEGSDGAAFPVEAVTPGNSVVSASHPGLGLATAEVTVVEAPSLMIFPEDRRLGLGEPLDFDITLSAPAGIGGLTVAIVADPPGVLDVPGQAFIAEGGNETQFTVIGAAHGLAMLELEAEGYRPTATTVEVVPPSIELPSSIYAAPGVTRQVPISLSHPAPAEGLEILLQADEPGTFNVQSAALVAAGEQSVQFELTGVSAGQAVLTASAAGYESATATVVVGELTLRLEPDDNPWLPVGVGHDFSVHLSDIAPPGGLTVEVSVNDTDTVAFGPAELYIPEGQTQADGLLYMEGVDPGEAILNLAFAGGETRTYTVTVTDPLEVTFSRTAFVIGRGLVSYSNNISATLWSGDQQYRPYANLPLPLVCEHAARCHLFGSAIVSAGNHTVGFRLQGGEAGDTRLLLDAPAIGIREDLLVTVVGPELQIQTLAGTRGVGSVRDNVRLRWYVPNGTSANQANSTLADDRQVHLSIVDDAPEGLIDGLWNSSSGGQLITEITFPATWNSWSNSFYVGTPTAPGSYRVRVAVDGLVETVSPVQTVQSPELAFNSASVITGRGLVSYSSVVTIQRQVNGSPYSATEPLEVSLQCVDDTICSVPETVIIAAGQSTGNVPITGVSVGVTTIIASATGYVDADSIAVEVVDPVLEIQTLAGTRSVGSVRDNVRLRWYVPNGTSANQANSTLADDRQVHLSIVDDDPEGLIDGLWDSSSGGQLITAVTFPAGSNLRNNIFYVGTPAAPGSYRVRAVVDDLVEAVSPVQTVQSPELAFNRASVVAGRGLVSYISVVTIQRQVDGSPYSGAEPLEVSLQCVDDTICSVPETVIIAAGQSTGNVPITGVSMGATAIMASAADHVDPELIAVEVVDPTLDIQMLVGTRSLGSVRDNVRLRWYVPNGTSANQANSTLAEDGQVQLSIVDDDPKGLIDGLWDSSSGGQLITAVTFPAGSNLRNNIFYVGTPTEPGSYRVRVAVDGLAETISSEQTVVTPELAFSRSDLVAADRMTTSGLLTIWRLAQGNTSSTAAPVAISLACGSTAVCQVPATVTIPANGSSVTVPVTGVNPGATTITASAIGHQPASPVAVTTVRPQLQFLNFPSTVTAGSTSNFRLRLYVPESHASTGYLVAEPHTFDLTSNFPAVLGLQQGQASITSGNTSGWITLEGLSPGQASITASGEGLEPRTSDEVEVAP